MRYELVLTLDFGEVGSWKRKRPFRVRLDAGLLTALIQAASQAYRVYELLLINRPGDVWEYVGVELLELPPLAAELVEHARNGAQSRPPWTRHPWPEGRIPMKVFDSLFWDRDDDVHLAWMKQRDSEAMRQFAQQLLLITREAQDQLGWDDPLTRHVAARVRMGQHSYGWLDRDVAWARLRRFPPKGPFHTHAFYDKLREILKDPGLVAVSYSRLEDYGILRMLATEQRRRARTNLFLA